MQLKEPSISSMAISYKECRRNRTGRDFFIDQEFRRWGGDGLPSKF